jgi:hypothetical protein
MIARGYDINTNLIKALANFFRNAKSMSCVLAIDHNEIRLKPGTKVFYIFKDRKTSALTQYIATHKDSH